MRLACPESVGGRRVAVARWRVQEEVGERGSSNIRNLLGDFREEDPIGVEALSARGRVERADGEGGEAKEPEDRVGHATQYLTPAAEGVRRELVELLVKLGSSWRCDPCEKWLCDMWGETWV